MVAHLGVSLYFPHEYWCLTAFHMPLLALGYCFIYLILCDKPLQNEVLKTTVVLMVTTDESKFLIWIQSPMFNHFICDQSIIFAKSYDTLLYCLLKALFLYIFFTFGICNNPEINFCKWCEVEFKIYFFLRWMSSWVDTNYWEEHLFFSHWDQVVALSWTMQSHVQLTLKQLRVW